MYEEQNQETIFDRMYDALPDGITALEGTFMGNSLQPTASELAEVYLELDGTLKESSAVTAEEYESLKNKGADIGLFPLAAYKAAGYVTFYGDDGTEIEIETAVQTEAELVFYTTKAAVIADGEVAVPVIAEDFGVTYNLPPETIIDMPVMVIGVVSVINHEAIAGGTDEEDMEHFRTRLLDKVRRPSTGGNKYDYENWAREVPGVGFAKCIPRWQGKGTVQVLVCDVGGLPAEPPLCQRVETYIIDIQPIGADVTVSPPLKQTVNILVKIDSLEPLEDVQERIETKIRDYLKGLVFSGTSLSYAQIGRLIFEVPGVRDYADLEINGQTGNIPLPDKAVFVLGGVTVEQL